MKALIFFVSFLLCIELAHAQMDQALALECNHSDVAASEIRNVNEGTPNTLTTTPVNRLGEHIPGLGINDFRISKGRKIATIHDVTEVTAVENTIMRVVFMVDNSQSMSPHLSLLRQTLEKTMRDFSDAVRVSVMFFREGENPVPSFDYNGRPLPIVRFPYTYDKQRAIEYASRMLTERNLTRNTYLYDGVFSVAQQIDADTGKVDRSFAIVFSDGEDNRSIVGASAALLSAKSNTVYFTIDYLTETNAFLVDLANKTGGEHFHAKNAQDIERIFDEIAKKIVAKGYHVTYSFKNPPRASLTASTNELVMEEEIIRETFPLLNYVFFDQASSSIPERYSRLDAAGVSSFDESAIAGGALDFYYNALNIIASRLAGSPDATITITGYVNNTGEERNNRSLARSRAETVRDYFRIAWGIDDSRMLLADALLPSIASSSRDTMGQVENRRVEITSSSPELLRPVTFVRRIASVHPPTVTFTPRVDVEEGLESWVLTTEQGGDEFDVRRGTQTESSITWNWKNQTGELPASSGVLHSRFLVQDKAGDSFVTDPVAINVREITQETRQNVSISEDGITVEKISLILFPFDVAEPGERNLRVMDEYVFPRIVEDAHIIVSGYTDIIGSDDYNMKLSQQRADAVTRILLGRLGDDSADRITSIGMGKTDPIFSNDTPEGRFYNRTVSLRIER